MRIEPVAPVAYRPIDPEALAEYQLVEATQKKRAQRRRIAEMSADNSRDVKIEIPAAYLKGGARTGKTVNTRRILGLKKTLAGYFDEDSGSAQKYFDMAAEPSVYPHQHMCSVCGYFGTVKCLQCGARYCSIPCGSVHVETMCQARY